MDEVLGPAAGAAGAGAQTHTACQRGEGEALNCGSRTGERREFCTQLSSSGERTVRSRPVAPQRYKYRVCVCMRYLN